MEEKIRMGVRGAIVFLLGLQTLLTASVVFGVLSRVLGQSYLTGEAYGIFALIQLNLAMFAIEGALLLVSGLTRIGEVLPKGRPLVRAIPDTDFCPNCGYRTRGKLCPQCGYETKPLIARETK